MEGVASCHKLRQRKQLDGVDRMVLAKSERGGRIESSRGRFLLYWGICGGLSRLLLCSSRYRAMPMRPKTFLLCLCFHHTALNCPSCCNQRGVAVALRMGTLKLAVIVAVTWSKKSWRVLSHHNPHDILFLCIEVLRDDGLSACRGRPRIWLDCGDMYGVRCGAISQPERREQTDLDKPHSILSDLSGDGSPLQHSNGSRTVCARSSKWFAATIHTALHILPFGLSAGHVCL